ncbi:hypothetical protein ACVU7I_13645, partial [Patulibacter sp. S7RM1-6]
MPGDADGAATEGTVRALGWDELLPVLLDFMGRRVMVQVWDVAHGREGQPVLASFGRLAGGPVGTWAGSDALMLSLTAPHGENSGLLVLRESLFLEATQRIPGAITVRLQTIEVQLAGALQGVVCQQILPTADGLGRTVAMEILLPTPAV